MRVTHNAPTLDDVAHAIEQWQTATFGPPGDPLVSLGKLFDEAAELRDELRQLPIAGTEGEHTARIREELADVLFLVIDLARGFGSVDALTEAADAKLARNRARVWTQGDGGKWSGSK